MYTGELDLTKQSGDDILGFLIASDELLLEELFKHVQVYLIKKTPIGLNRILFWSLIPYSNLLIARDYKIVVLNRSVEIQDH